VGAGRYKLSASGLPDDDYANDALTTGRVVLEHPASGTINYAGDRDWFAVQLLAGGVYRFDLVGDSLDDPFLQVFTRDNVLAALNNVGTASNPHSAVAYYAPYSGTYFLQAQSYSGHQGNYTISATPIVPMDDYAGDASTRGNVPVGGAVSGRIDTVGDADWFAVVLAAGVPYRFRLDSDGIRDPFLGLFGPGGTRVAYDDDGGGSNNSVITYTPTVTGKYHLAVSDVALSTGGYTLQAEYHQPADDAYSIEVVFVTNTEYDDFFTAAAQRWEEVITSDLRDASNSEFGVIDDLLIRVDVRTIDGEGGILGQATVDSWRVDSDGGLPYIGYLRLDIDDIANIEASGVLDSTILHEMGHVLGLLASGFSRMDLLKPGDPYTYVGANAVMQYRVVAGDLSLTSVPIETHGGDGTRKHHWDDERFGNEIMTGWIESVPPQPISIVTVGALADLGYGVNYAAADPFHL
jgi:hypothetical protein